MNSFVFGVDLTTLDREPLLEVQVKVNSELERRRVAATAPQTRGGLHPDVLTSHINATRMAESRDSLGEKLRRDAHERLKDKIRRGVIDTNGWHLLNCDHCKDCLFRDDIGGMHWEGRHNYYTLAGR